MTFFRWDQRFALGITRIDQQHQKLVELTNRIYESMKSGKGNQAIAPILTELSQYTQTHFATEEELFLRYGYPGYLDHKQEHDLLVQQVKRMQIQLQQGSSGMSIKLANFLKAWLIDHIMKTDREYVPYLKEKGVR